MRDALADHVRKKFRALRLGQVNEEQAVVELQVSVDVTIAISPTTVIAGAGESSIRQADLLIGRANATIFPRPSAETHFKLLRKLVGM